MADQLTREALFEETDRTLKAITSSAFLDRMKNFRNEQPAKRSYYAQNFMTREALIAGGAPLPPDMRMSSRVFDDSPNYSSMVDYDSGQKIIELILKEDPTALRRLQDDNPEVYENLKKDFESWGVPIVPEMSPDDLISTPLDPLSIPKPQPPE